MNRIDIILCAMGALLVISNVVQIVLLRSRRLVGPRGARGIVGPAGPVGATGPIGIRGMQGECYGDCPKPVDK